MIYDYQNIGYQMPSAPYPMMQTNMGGYPGGYPPVVPQQMGMGMQMNQPMFPGQQQMPVMTGFGNSMIPTNPQMTQPMGYGIPQQAPMKKGPDLSMPIPGVTTPLEIEFNDGTSITIPPSGQIPIQQDQMAMGYTPGGARISQGGFNPINGVTTPAIGAQGFNPYYGQPAPQPQMMMPNQQMVMGMINQVQSGPAQQFIGNPGYATATPQRSPNPSNFGMGFAPYSPPGVDPYAFKQPWEQQNQIPGFMQSPMGMNGMGMYPFMQGQNQFNYTLQDFLYEEQPSAIDARELLAQVVLSDKEREKIGQMRNDIIGYDYFSRPIYSNNGYYRQSMEMQQQFEQARYDYQSYFTNLSKIAHAYSGEKIDEAATMKRFDPVPPAPPAPKYFNPMTATPEERKAYENNQRVANCLMLDNMSYQCEAMKTYNDLIRENLYAQIKASHDKLIGVQPGEHYDMKTFMDNGYKIGVDIAMRKAKSANRNGTTKYSRSAFRQDMNANPRSINQAQVPVTSVDDEYVSVEEMLKSVYNRNKANMYQKVNPVDESKLTLIRDKNGRVQYVSDATAIPMSNVDDILGPDASERESHAFFLRAIQQKKDIDDVKRGLN